MEKPQRDKRWQNDWRMDTPPGLRVEDSDADFVLTGSIFRYVVHVPTGLKVRCLIDPEGHVMSGQSDDDARGDLLFKALEFCQDYLDRAGNKKLT